MVKKRVPSKSTRKRKTAAAATSRRRGDRSRLDLKPLQDHIRKRIKDLKKGGGHPLTGAAVAGGDSNEETIARLENALETLMDICHPTMDIPI